MESYFARAKAYEALNNPAKAADDFRRATQLAPASVFEALAQAESKRKIQGLSKKVPCGSGGQQSGTCTNVWEWLRHPTPGSGPRVRRRWMRLR